MPLPTCECITGKPIQTQLGAIYCALLEILAGQGGGEITLSQISDLDGSWIAPLQTPVGNFSITASQISDATAAAQGLLINLPAGDPAGSYVRVDDVGGATVSTVIFSGNGLTSVDVADGLVTAGT